MSGGTATIGPSLEVRGLTKTFGPTAALNQFDLVVAPGEIHGLVGRNGSGKSTLTKILSGYYLADQFDVLHVDGSPLYQGAGVGASRSAGIGFVHQDLALIPDVSILENMRVGRWERSRLGTIQWRKERAKVVEDLATVGLFLNPDQKIRDFGLGVWALVAVARALRDVSGFTGRGVLVLDEPTVALTAAEVHLLFSAIRRIAAAGTSVLFISHRLAEVREITDRISVIRDGENVATFTSEKCTEEELVDAILGRRLSEFYPERSPSGRGVALHVSGLKAMALGPVSFEVHDGEIVGLTGLVGTGHESLPYLIAGVEMAHGGTLTLGEQTYEFADLSPAKTIGCGLVLVPADKQRLGVVPQFSIRENIALPMLSKIVRFRMINHQREREIVMGVIGRYGINPPNPEALTSSLSGGNQQKVVIAKWLQLNPRVLVMHEPTQGIDVGAKRDIFDEIEHAARGGTAVIICSNEYEDLAHLCHRVLVFGHGHITSEITGEMSGDRIIEACYQASA